jgi:uncharacterized protein YndB with AHSA1/START domain
MTTTTDREFTITRLFEAPRELVWSAWTEPKHISKWWGPTGFTTSVDELELKPGGMWLHTMHGPDGRDYRNIVRFIEVEPIHRLVYQHEAHPDSEGVTHISYVTFEDRTGKTEVTMRLEFKSAEEFQRITREYGAIEGAGQHMESLQKYLEELSG